MNQPSNSPEVQPQSSQEQNFPQLEAEENVIRPEQYQPGAEISAEKQVEQDTLDQHVVTHPGQDQGSSDDSVATAAKSTPSPSSASIPDLADDVDVIEKAWVDKAKQVINETKDDPHAQEKAFEELQIEYHKKRYGRDIKASR